MTDLDLVEVIWFDSCSHHGWRDQDDFKPPGLSECRSVGYLVDQTAEAIRLCQSQSFPDPETRHIAELLAIPAQCVREVRHLTPVPRG